MLRRYLPLQLTDIFLQQEQVEAANDRMIPFLFFSPGTKMLTLLLPLHTAYLFPFVAKAKPLIES